MVAQTHSLALGARPSASIFYPRPSPMVGTAKLYRTGGVTGANGLTHCMLVPCDAPFTGGAINVYNNQTTPIVIDAVCVAPTAQPNDGFTPVDSTGAAVAWTVVSGGPWVIQPGDIIAPGVLGYKPAVAKIAFAVSSLARSDVSGAPPLLMLRVHLASGQLNAGTPATTQLDAQAAAYAARRPWNAFYKSGNFAGSNQTGIGTPTRGTIAAVAIDFATTVAVKTVMEFGDSTTQGAKSMVSVSSTSTLHDYNGALMVACDALSTLTRPVMAANCGFQGYTVDQFCNSAETWLRSFAPHIVIGQPWSINDPSQTQATVDAGFLKARAILLKAKRSGMIAAWRTALPSGSTSATNDVYRVAINNRCRADPDFPCVDYDAAMTNGASPARLQATYDSGDGTHPNASGYAQIASAQLQPFLQNYV